MSVEEFFKNLASQVNLGIGEEEQNLIAAKQNGLREKLREEIELEDDFLTGSYARDTITKPKDPGEEFDVDVFVAFSNEEYGEKDLEELRGITIRALRRVKAKHPGLGITNINEKQARSVGVEFGGNFQIDMVPSIQIEKDRLYKIFDARSLEAVRSNPKLHGQRLTDANARTESGSTRRLVPIIKILKSWKREKCDDMKSFHLEVLAVEILGNKKIESYSEGIARFFANTEGYFQEACLKDPANPKNIIDEYLDKDGTRDGLLSLVAREKAGVERARAFEASGDDEKAIREWKEVFSAGGEERTPSISVPIIVRSPAKPHAW